MNSRNWNIVAFVIINYLLSLTKFQLQKEKAASQNKGCPYSILKTSGNFHHHYHSIITVARRPGQAFGEPSAVDLEQHISQHC